MSRGKVRQFSWTYEGQAKKAWGFTTANVSAALGSARGRRRPRR